MPILCFMCSEHRLFDVLAVFERVFCLTGKETIIASDYNCYNLLYFHIFLFESLSVIGIFIKFAYIVLYKILRLYQ